MTIKPQQYLVDKQGRAKAIVIRMTDFKSLMQHVHELEDALDLKRAIDSSMGTISHETLMKQLKEQRLL